MEEQRGEEDRRRRDSIVEPIFGGLEGADEGAVQKKSAPESIEPWGASSLVRLFWLLALASLVAWWLLA